MAERVVKSSAAGKLQVRGAVPAPARWKPTAAGRMLAAAYRAMNSPAPKYDVELREGVGSRLVPRTTALPEGVLRKHNRFDGLPDEHPAAPEDAEAAAAAAAAAADDDAEEAPEGNVDE